MGFFSDIFKSLVKISGSTFVFNADKNLLQFKKLDDEYIKFPLEEGFEIKSRHDSYVIDAYTLKSKNIFIEYINLDQMASWRGLPRTIYEKFLKEKLKIRTLALLERKDIKNYEFSIFKVDDDFIIHFIYINEGSKDIFLIDTEGKLYTELLYNFFKKYKYTFDDEEKGEVNFDISIVKDNSVRQYFTFND